MKPKFKLHLKRFAKLLVSLCALNVISACSSIKIKNSEWCADVGKYGAECFHALSDDARTVPKAQWDRERVGMFCTESDNFANWKSAIEKFCADSKRCTYEEKKELAKLAKKLRRFQTKLTSRGFSEYAFKEENFDSTGSDSETDDAELFTPADSATFDADEPAGDFEEGER